MADPLVSPRFSPEARAKAAASNRGKKRTPEQLARMSETAKKGWSPERRARAAETRKGMKMVKGGGLRDGVGFYLMDGYRYLTGIYDHPLSRRTGAIAEHRKVLYDKIGPGPHACHWIDERLCGKEELTWGGVGGICVDHLDDDRLNNDPANLVAACSGCNGNRKKVCTGRDRRKRYPRRVRSS